MRRRAISVLIAGLCAFWGQGCGLSTPQHADSSMQRAASEEYLKALSEKIKSATANLEYSGQIADEFASMVLGWKDSSNHCAVAVLAGKLAQAKQNTTSQSDIAAVERDVTRQLVAQIIRRIEPDTAEPGIFDLADVVESHKAQCLGFSQVFYITANSIGLSAKAVNVLELEERNALPPGASHVADIVELSDGKTIMINSVAGGHISRPFVMMDIFEIAGNYLQLKNNRHLPGIYGKIQILDEKGLIAYIFNNRAVGHIKEGQFQVAIIDSSKAIILYPVLAEAWNNRGIAYRKMDRIRQAISDYTRAIELNPQYPEAWNNRGVAYMEFGQNGDALADCDKALEINPGFAEAYCNRGNVYSSMGQIERAIEDYGRAISHNPNLAQAYRNRGVNYALLGKTEQAKKDLTQALRLAPSMIDNVMKVSERHNLGLKVYNAAVAAQ